MVRLSPAALPDGSLLALADVVGRSLASPIRSGEVLTDARLLAGGLLSGYGPGTVATPVRIADAAAARLLRTGDVVDVLAAAANPELGVVVDARLVASAVKVIAVGPPEDRSLAPDVGGGALVVLATTPATAARLAGAAVSARLSMTIRPS
jgi:pilus assembly protein CpaB